MNEISKYIVKLWKKRYPEDTMYQFSKRVNIDQATFTRMLKSKGAFKQGEFLMRIASVLGVSMESLLLQQETEYEKDTDLKHWKEKYFESEQKLKEMESKLKNLAKQIKDI